MAEAKGAEEAILIMEVINNGNVLFEEEVINEWFTFESEEDLLDYQLNMVLDWID